MVHDSLPAQGAASRTNIKSLLLNILIAYTALTTCTMILATTNNLNSDIQRVGSRNNYCSPEKRTPSKFWSRHDTMKGSEVTTVVGEDAQHFWESSQVSHGKYPISETTSSRTLMILDEKMLEPAIDGLVEFIVFVALIFTAIFLGAAILIAL